MLFYLRNQQTITLMQCLTKACRWQDECCILFQTSFQSKPISYYLNDKQLLQLMEDYTDGVVESDKTTSIYNVSTRVLSKK